MILNEIMAMDVLKNPKHKNEIQSVKDQESQLRVFTEELSKDELIDETYWTNLMSIMKARSDKKFDRVIEFARYPLPIVQMSDSILNDYFKIFDGKNRYFDVEADRNIQRLNDWIREFEPVDWIENKAKQVFKNKPNSFVVVDQDESGNPYLILVDSSRLIDAKFKNKKGDLEYIAFIHSVKIHETKSGVVTTLFSVYDDKKYYVFAKDSDSDEYREVSSNEHNVGYCPAKSFISTASNSKNPFKRRVAFSSATSKMEDWTIFDVFRNYVDHYAPFPVTEAPQKKCANNECQNGVVSEEVVTDIREGTTRTVYTKCEVCGGADNGQHIYPGTHIGIKVQSDKSLNDGSGVFKMIFPDVDKLKYVPEKLDDIEVEVRLKTVGVNNLSNNEAFNEMQVKGSFASMESILLRSKTEMDIIYKWSINTVGRLIYSNIKLNVEANFGTEFYLVSEDDLQARFKKAKDIGLPPEEQLNIYKQLVQTKYKGNLGKIQRELMLLDLDPYPMYSIEECIKLKNESVLDDFQLSLKVNFLKFISKFESENTEITNFGLLLPYWAIIEQIENSLYIYNQELIDEKNIRNNPSSSSDDDNAPQVTQEQLEAQANLRGSVGGVQGILGIQDSVSRGITGFESAIATMVEIYGFSRDTAVQILGTETIKQPINNLENGED